MYLILFSATTSKILHHFTNTLQWVGRWSSLNQNNYVIAGPTPVDADYTILRMRAYLLGALNLYSANQNDIPSLIISTACTT